MLGPLLFLIYINDLQITSPVCCRLFADDCVAYMHIQSVKDQQILNNFLAAVSNWCSTWQMRLNVSKCVQMSVTRKKEPLVCTYSINNVPLASVDQFKYLGLHISSTLSWSGHVQFIVSKALRKLYMLRNRMMHCTPKTKLVAYTTLVRPLLEYADVVWDPHTKCDIDCIERVQKKSAKIHLQLLRQARVHY